MSDQQSSSGSFFGANTSSQPPGTASKPTFSFGNSTGQSPLGTGSPFGASSQPASDATKNAMSSPFSLSTPSKPSSAAGGSGIGNSTTPAGPPPSSSVFGNLGGGGGGGAAAGTGGGSTIKNSALQFGSGTGSAGLFSSNTSTPPSSASLFSKPADDKASSASTPNVFGAAFKPSTPATGDASKGPATASLFGAKTDDKANAGPSSMFLGGSKPAGGDKPAFGIFGNTSSTPSSTPASAPATSNLFGSKAPASSAPASSNLFGTTPTQPAPAASSAAPSATPAPAISFGGGAPASSSTPSLFNAKPPASQPESKPAFSAANAPAPSLFGSKTTATQAEPSTASAAISTGNTPSLFGQKPATTQPETSTAASNANPTKPSPFGPPVSGDKPAGFSLFSALGSGGSGNNAAGSKPETAATPSQTAAPGAPSSFFAPAATSQPGTGDSKATPSLAPPASGAPAGNSLFNTTPSGQTSTNAACAQPETAATDAKGASTLGASVSGPAPDAQSRLKNKSMDEIITKWATDLQKYQKDFQTQAERVAQWDRLLVENSNAIQKLYSRTFQAERDTSEVHKQLSNVENSQNELESWLNRYEKDMDDLMSREGMGPREGLSGPDQERDRSYRAAERASEKLNEMGQELTTLIEEINAVSATLSNTSQPDDPLSQIVRILNTHLSQLQQIDSETTSLQARVATAQRENQRLGSSTNGLGHAADDFYRSYMRR